MFTEQTLKRKPFVIDGNPYRISLTAQEDKVDQPLSIRVTIEADYGHRSTCIVRGLQNYYWDSYVLPDQLNDPGAIQIIQLTPKALCQVVKFAHERGWDPVNSKSNCEVVIENRDILEMQKPDADS